MSDFFNNLFKVLTDKTVSFYKRTGLFMVCVLGLIVINDTFSFSFNYRINQKIEQLKTLYSMYPKGKMDSTAVVAAIKKLESEIQNRRAFVSKVKDISFKLSHNELSASQKIVISKLFWGNIIFVVLFLVFPFVENNKKDLMAIYLGLTLVVIILNFIFFAIPTFDHLIINHAINIAIGVVFLIAMYIYGSKES